MDQDQQNKVVDTEQNNTTQKVNKPSAFSTLLKRSKNKDKKSSGFWNRCRVITAIVIAIVVAVIVVAKCVGVMYIGFKSPSQQVSIRTIVCGSDDIAYFNALFESEEWEGERLISFANDMQARPNSDKDPNCQYIVWYVAAFITADLGGMEQSLANLKHLNEKGHFLSGDLLFVYTIRNMEDLVESVRESMNTTPDGFSGYLDYQEVPYGFESYEYNSPII